MGAARPVPTRPQGPQPPSPPPARRLREGAPRPPGLTETREPPSCSVDALAAVSLGSTERQQPLAVTGAKRRQRRREPGSPAGRRRRGGLGRGSYRPPLGLAARTWPAVTLSPSPRRALQQERLGLDRRKDAPRQWESFIHHKYPWAPRGAHW